MHAIEIYLLRASNLWSLVRIVGVDGECEVELTTLVHAFRQLLGSARASPSSGVMSSVKLRISAGSGNVVFIVSGSSSSVRSEG
jgi:hypothetical protein